MRKVLVLLLAIVAVGAAGVWAFGEYGGNFFGTKIVMREPEVREPELVAANDAVAPPTANEAPALRSATAPPEQTVAPQSAPAPEALADTESSVAAAPPQGNPLAPDTLDAPASGTRSAAEPPPAAPPSATPPPAPPASEPVLRTQSEPAAVPAVAAAAAAAPSVADEVKKRTLTYNRPPEKLALNRAIDVSLVINATNNPDAGKDALKGFPGTPTEATVEASDTVQARLTGVGFDIVSLSGTDLQRLSGKVVNRWHWRVTPTELGKKVLILDVIGFAAGSNAGEPLDTFTDEIVVEVQQIDQVINWAKGVQPLFAVLAALAGAMSALFAFLRFREEKKRNTSA
jgi:hypothetical protein